LELPDVIDSLPDKMPERTSERFDEIFEKSNNEMCAILFRDPS